MACDLPSYDICIQEGTDYTLVLSITDDDGIAIDLTGATAELNIRFLLATTTYVGVVNGNSITFTIPETEIYTAYAGMYQVDYTLNSITTRIVRGGVYVERAL